MKTLLSRVALALALNLLLVAPVDGRLGLFQQVRPGKSMVLCLNMRSNVLSFPIYCRSQFRFKIPLSPLLRVRRRTLTSVSRSTVLDQSVLLQVLRHLVVVEIQTVVAITGTMSSHLPMPSSTVQMLRTRPSSSRLSPTLPMQASLRLSSAHRMPPKQ